MMSSSTLFSTAPNAVWSWLKSTRPFVRYATVAVILVIALLVLVAMWSVLGDLPFWFWQLTLLCVAALVVVWWFTRGVRWYDRRRVIRQELGDLKPGDPLIEADARRNLKAAIGDACTTVHRSPQLEAGALPLYRIPWFLFVGDEAAAQTDLLRTATTVASPFPAPHKPVGGDVLWTFWFFKRLIAIETSSAFVCDPDNAGPRGLWYHAMQLLHQHREELPINGVVVTAAAERLLESPDKLREFGLKMRRLVDEAMHHLEVDVPVYLVVTGLDRLPGYAHFAKHLPSIAKDHAVGERIDWDKPDARGRWERGNEIFETIRARFHGIRLSALRKEGEGPQRKGIFEFVERFGELKQGFTALLHCLVADNPFSHQPKLRGIYFVASGGDAPAFVRDVFTRFLPSDQPLANRRGRWAARRWLRSTVSAVTLFVLCAGLLTALVYAYNTDRQLAKLSQAACPQTVLAEQDANRKLAGVMQCEENLRNISTRWKQSGLSFGLRSHRAAFYAAQSRFVAAYGTAVRQPLDEYLASTIAAGTFGTGEYVGTLQRLAVLRGCSPRDEQCSLFPKQFVFDPQNGRQLNPSLKLRQPLALKDHARLFNAYMSFASWQGAAAAGAEASRLEAQLAQMGTKRQLKPADWQNWAAERYQTYSLDQFWKPPRAVESERSRLLPQVPALFTANFLKEVLIPLQSAAYAHLPAAKAPLDTFVNEYWPAYFRAWAAFFRDFYQGARLWSGDYDGLAQRLVENALPYQALFAEMEENIWSLPLRMPWSNRFALLWLDIKHDWTGIFRHIGRCYRSARAAKAKIGAVDAPIWVLAVAESQKRSWPEVSAITKKFVQSVHQDAKGQQTYTLAAEIFKSGGNGGSGLAQEFPKLHQPFDAPPDKYLQRMGADDQVGWGGMKGPARVVLIVLTARAGSYIQRLWDTNVVQAAARMGKTEQDVVLWGDQGRVNAFLNDQLAPFVTPKERLPIQVLDVGLPFASGYGVLTNRAAIDVAPKEPFPAGVFSFKQASSFGGMPEGSLGSEFSLVCRGTPITLKSKSKMVTDRAMKMYWSPEACDKARVEVYLPDAVPTSSAAAPAAQPAAAMPATSLAKDYMGRDGFMQLLQDYRSGSKVYALSDFKASYPASEWKLLSETAAALQVSSVRVYLDIEKSPELERYLQASQLVAGGLPTSIMQ